MLPCPRSGSSKRKGSSSSGGCPRRCRAPSPIPPRSSPTRPRWRSRGTSSIISPRRRQKRFLPPPESNRLVASILDKVDAPDAGDRLILSSQDQATLKDALDASRKQDALGL